MTPRPKPIALSWFLVCSAAAALVAAGCAPAAEHVESPAHTDSSQAALTIGPDGSSYVSDFELDARGLLAEVARNPSAFDRMLVDSVGAGYDRNRAEALRQKMVAGDWGWMPVTYLVGADVLPTMLGAYSQIENKVFMRSDLPASPARMFIYLEEVGHFLDGQLNASDTPGDEGELFRRAVFGETLASWERVAVVSRNDHATITFGGRQIPVETFSIGFCVPYVTCSGGSGGSGGLPSFDYGRAVVYVESELLKKAAQLGLFLNEGAVQGAKSLVDRLERSYKTTFKLLTDLKSALVGLGLDTRAGLKLVSTGLSKIAQGDIGAGVTDFFEGLGTMGAEGPISFVTSAGGALLSKIQTDLGFESVGGPLTAEEKEYLNHVFRGTVALGNVIVKQGFAGLLSLSDRAFTLDNTIYLKKKNRAHRPLMVHETVHVWQFQNLGSRYKIEALTARAFGAGDEWLAGYNAGEQWASFNREQQGELFEDAQEAGFFTSGVFEKDGVDYSRFTARAWASMTGRGTLYPAAKVRKSFNGDASADLMFFEPGNGSIHVVTSSGSALPPANIAVWSPPFDFGSQRERFFPGDFDGDGDIDLGYFEDGNSSFHVKLSDRSRFVSAGMWVPPGWFGSPQGKHIIGDFNGDGADDLGYFEPGDGSFHVSLSTRSGFFAPGSGRWIASSFGHTAGTFLTGDFNGDGRTDLAFAEPGNATVFVRLSTGAALDGPGSGRWVGSTLFGHGSGRYFVGDFNGDRRDDLGFFEPGDQSFHVALSADIGFVPRQRWVQPFMFGSNASGFFPGDWNGDGSTDLGYFEYGNRSFYVALSTGTALLGPGSGMWSGSNWFGHEAGRHYASVPRNRP